MIRLAAFLLFWQLTGYLIGGIPFAYLIAWIVKGVDIRSVGSGNVGATNVGRLLGFRYFVIAFILDFLKGALPVAGAVWFQQTFGATLFPNRAPLRYLPEMMGFATIIGHIFPVYLGLRGGKGVATTIGVILVLAPYALLVGMIGFLLALLASGMVSVGSIFFAGVFPLCYLFMNEEVLSTEKIGLSVFVVGVSMLILVKHVGNIGRIIQGTESQVKFPWSPK